MKIVVFLLILTLFISSCTGNVQEPQVQGNKSTGDVINISKSTKIIENITIPIENKINESKRSEEVEKKILQLNKSLEPEFMPKENESIQSASQDKIKIATFNIQIFGISKREKKEVMEILKKIVRNFDIVAIQEVRDNTQTTIPFFLSEINSIEGPRYGVVYSERLGRTSSKEQYAFYYNTEKVAYKPNSAYTYKDDNDYFEREPFVAGFSAGIFDFFLINIHTKPEDAFNEINKLDLVVKDAKSKYTEEEDFIVLGDFNADCNYFNEKADSTALETTEYYWVIEDNTDTTTRSTICTYDRIVLKKDATLTDYTGNWNVFRFDSIYGLSQEITVDVSDHYPVWAEFYSDRDNDEITNIVKTETTQEGPLETITGNALYISISSVESVNVDANCVSLGCPEGTEFVGSKNSDVYHRCHCSYAKRILKENLVCFSTEQGAIDKGYRAAKKC